MLNNLKELDTFEEPIEGILMYAAICYENNSLPIDILVFLFLGLYQVLSYGLLLLLYKRQNFFPIKGRGPKLIIYHGVLISLWIGIPYVIDVILFINPIYLFPEDPMDDIPFIRKVLKGLYMTLRLNVATFHFWRISIITLSWKIHQKKLTGKKILSFGEKFMIFISKSVNFIAVFFSPIKK